MLEVFTYPRRICGSFMDCCVIVACNVDKYILQPFCLVKSFVSLSLLLQLAKFLYSNGAADDDPAFSGVLSPSLRRLILLPSQCIYIPILVSNHIKWPLIINPLSLKMSF